MSQLSLEDQAAIVLNILGEELADSVFEDLSSESATAIRSRREALLDDPPTEEQIDQALEEYERMLRFAMGGALERPPIQKEQVEGALPKLGERDGGSTSQSGSPTIKLFGQSESDFATSDDPVADLDRLLPQQLAGALQSELPRIIAVVLNKLSEETAGQTLALLPDDLRNNVFVQLKDEPQIPNVLLDRIASVTLEKALVVDVESVGASKTGIDQKLANLLRTLEKKERSAMIESLEESDEDIASKVRELMYVFDDLFSVQDRSLQKLLAEVDTPSLAKGLKAAEPDQLKKVLNNLSQRAKDALAEEMELTENIHQDDVDAAQKIIVEIMARLDQSGDLVMED
jgi:flagellar motor switch protein FliG